jgi:hypothetical protein
MVKLTTFLLSFAALFIIFLIWCISIDDAETPEKALPCTKPRHLSHKPFKLADESSGVKSRKIFWGAPSQKCLRGNSAKKHSKQSSNGSNYATVAEGVDCYKLDRQVSSQGTEMAKVCKSEFAV